MDHNATVKIGEAARIARVTVRTLHHYDAIGLLRPSHRSNGEYRLYTRQDLARLHQIRLYRELDMPLAKIREVLDDPGFDARSALLVHREQIMQRVDKDRGLIANIDRMLQGADDMDTEEMFEGFKAEEYAAEAQERWGQTESWKIAQARTKTYGPEQMAAIQAEHEGLLRDFADSMGAGHGPDSEVAVDLAERVRLHMDHWYYPLTRSAHQALARLYVGDPRFSKVFEQVESGLTAYLASAIDANAARGDGPAAAS